jgi:hypothetical protein
MHALQVIHAIAEDGGFVRGRRMARYVRATLTALAMVVVAFCITWALIFWTPFFPQYSQLETVDTSYPLDAEGYTQGRFKSSGPGESGRLIERESETIQKLLRGLYAELLQKPNDELYILKSVDDPCMSESLECNGVPTKTVKPFIEAALAQKHAVEAATIGWRGLFVAMGSLIVSFFSLIVAFAALFKRRATHAQ